MSYPNLFLSHFRPVYMGILAAKEIAPNRAELEIIDEEADSEGIFETSGICGVLEQLAPELNFLTIYTDRPAYFSGFTETMYEENGLLVTFFSKQDFKQLHRKKSISHRKEDSPCIILDFEWKGSCYEESAACGNYYIPIHKKPWEMAENLDIAVPIGYNTVIVKRTKDRQEKPWRDRFEAAFYSS